jgi:diacylglycerol kinase family enzyme
MALPCFPPNTRDERAAATPSSRGFVPVEPARRPVLFINPTSGRGKAQRARLADLARERGIEPVTLAQGDGLEAFIQGAVADGADALGVAGGDGSLALVASAAAGRRIPFVCVPAGTRNHFARDVGVAPNDLIGALDAFGAALERTIDLGYVNARPFLNNVSLGIYGDAVQRGDYRDAKLRTLLETAEEEALGSGSAPADVHLVDDRGREHHGPAVVLVSNNPYAFDRQRVRGARPGLDSGQLGIVLIDAPAGPPHRAARAWSARSLRVDASGTVPAGVHGEAVTLAPPLRFTIHPKALRVRIAPRQVRQDAFPAHEPPT